LRRSEVQVYEGGLPLWEEGALRGRRGVDRPRVV